MSNLDLIQRNDREGWLGQLNQGIRTRRHQDIATVRDTIEVEFSERNVDGHTVLSGGVRDLLSKALELSIKFGPSSSLLLLLLKLFFVAISVLAFAVSRLVKGHVGGFSIKLHIPCLSLPDDDWVLEVDMDEHNQFTDARLEEQVLDVGKDHINVVVAKRREISQAILMDFNFTRHTFSILSGTKVDIGESERTTVADLHQLVLFNNIFHFLLLLFTTNG